ncbi:DUF4158 domain-containing protein [Nonomuraea sp. ZG12]
MPMVEFLTDDEASAYGQYGEVPSRADLERVFFLDDEDRELVERRRGDHMKLGFSLQLVPFRWVGRSSPHRPAPTDCPRPHLHLARHPRTPPRPAVDRATRSTHHLRNRPGHPVHRPGRWSAWASTASAASHLREGGADVAQVQALLGHASLDTSARYFRAGTAEQAAVVDRVFA